MSTSPLHRIFCERVRAKRTALKLTQVAAAERMGISQSNYAGIENGRYEPTISTLQKVALALETTPASLLSSDDN